MLRALRVIPAAEVAAAAVADTVVLDREDRYRRRFAMTGEGGLAFLLDLPEAQVLEDGDGLALEDGRVVQVRAAAEPVAIVTARTPAALMRIAWHLGNRHLPTEVHPFRLVFRRDHVIEAMVAGLGGRLDFAEAPFRPEGGAYGHGVVHGHDGHDHGHADADAHAHGDHGHAHAHAHDHDHGHAHSHAHSHSHGHSHSHSDDHAHGHAHGGRSHARSHSHPHRHGPGDDHGD